MVRSNLLTIIDLGSSKASLVCVKVINRNEFELVSYASVPSLGVKKGSIVNIEAASKSIKEVIEQAQQQTNSRIKSAYVSISGDKIHSLNSLGVVPIRNDEIAESDIDAVIESATATPLASDQKIIHVLPQDYIVDCQPGIKDPLGMSGVRLETNAHIICGNDRSIQNLRKCMQLSDIRLDGMIFEGLASSQAVISSSEKDQGVCVIDIGAGTSSITIYQSGSIVYTAVLPFAGDQVTNDLAHALKTSHANAENLKIEQGSLFHFDDEDEIEYKGLDSKTYRVSRSFLMQVIEARYSEVFHLIHKNISHKVPKWKHSLGAGVVLTGGGSLLDGLSDFAQSILGIHTRVVDVNDDLGCEELQCGEAATLVGLVKYCIEQQFKGATVVKSKYRQSFKRLREWLEVNF